MKLMLDHTQRLNLHALLGAQRADVGSIRAIWAIQDRIALDAGEEKAVEAEEDQKFGSPLLLRLPLDMGVKVTMRHDDLDPHIKW